MAYTLPELTSQTESNTNIRQKLLITAVHMTAAVFR